MSSKKGGFVNLLYSTIMPKVYGLGATVVILGAMFKIQHLPGAGFMLGLGLGVEAGIFFLSAFEPKKHEVDWSKIYPELGEDYEDMGIKTTHHKSHTNITKELDKVIGEKIPTELVDSLGKGMKTLADSARQLAGMSNAATATSEYAIQAKEASSVLKLMTNGYRSTAESIIQYSAASKEAQEYQKQVVIATKSLNALNTVYEMELKDTNIHLKSMNSFYTNVGQSMENIFQAGKDTEQFRTELSKLTNNISQLNKVYGSMLSAMKN